MILSVKIKFFNAVDITDRFWGASNEWALYPVARIRPQTSFLIQMTTSGCLIIIKSIIKLPNRLIWVFLWRRWRQFPINSLKWQISSNTIWSSAQWGIAGHQPKKNFIFVSCFIIFFLYCYNIQVSKSKIWAQHHEIWIFHDFSKLGELTFFVIFLKRSTLLWNAL